MVTGLPTHRLLPTGRSIHKDPVKAKGNVRVQSHPGDAQPQVRRVSQPRTDRHGRRQTQSAAVHVGLNFMSLLSEIEIGFGSYKDGGNVIERILLLRVSHWDLLLPERSKANNSQA